MPRIDPRRAAAFLKDPGAARLVLLHGDDPGLVRERSDALRAVVAGGDDPFRTADLSREQAQRTGALAGEAAALSMTGGRRVVRVRDATDAHSPAAREVLAGAGEALVILEGGELPKSSKLRALAEGTAPGAVSLECWRERGAELAATIGALLAGEGVRAEPAALDWLAERLGEDRGILRRSVEVLALHTGPGGTLGEEDVLGLMGDGSALDLDEALMAATAGDAARAERAFAAAFDEGTNPVQALRAAQRHLHRLHLASLAVAAGQPPGSAMAGLRPPVFFRHKPAFEQALRRWRPASLAAAAAAMAAAEAQAKSGGTGRPLPDRAIARQALLALVRGGASRR